MTSSPSLALVFATIERPQAAQRLIRSVRKHCAELPIYVADQSRQIGPMSSFYAANDVHLVRMPYDSGVTASRNRLVDHVSEDYIVLCDDDFILGASTEFRDAIRILEAEPELGVIGGRLYDCDGGDEWLRNWELFLEYDPLQKILFSIPIYQLAPKVHQVGRLRYYICDAVLNFAVFRKSIFSAGVQWDEQFKSNGEHEDFYLNLKVNFPFRVAYLPTMVAYHHHPEEYRVYRTRLRDRNEGWRRFFDKWGLEQHVEFGLGVRTIDDIGHVTEAEQVRSRFFVNADLSLQWSEAVPGTLLIGDFENIAAVGALDKDGNRTEADAATATLLLDLNNRRIVVVPDAAHEASVRRIDISASPEETDRRYQLETFATRGAVGFLQEGFFFRYDPILRNDTDFYLWYARDASQAGEKRSEQALACVVRWSRSDARILVWKSQRKFLALEATPYWRPLLLDLPLWPRGCGWLRFDIVVDGGLSPDPICTGFLFRAAESAGRPAAAPGAADIEVLGLSRLANDGAMPGHDGRPLDEVARSATAIPVSLNQLTWPLDLVTLRIDEVPGLEVLFFLGWEGLGRSLVSARLPSVALPAPAVIGLPAPSGGTQRRRIFGYGAARGFVALGTSSSDPPARR